MFVQGASASSSFTTNRAAAAANAVDAAVVKECRDRLTWPFSEDSIWNMVGIHRLFPALACAVSLPVAQWVARLPLCVYDFADVCAYVMLF